MKRTLHQAPAILAIAIGTLTASLSANAYEIYHHNDRVLNADLEAVFGIMHSKKNYNTFGNRGAGSSTWREGYIKYGLSGSQGLHDNSSLYGALSFLSSGTWGDGDASGLTEGSERHTDIEDGYIGWRSGSLFPMFGENGVDISFGRQLISIGDGFLIHGDMLNLGDIDLGRDFDRGGSYYLAARKTFGQTAVLRLGGEQGWRGDLMWLKSDNPAQADTELAVTNIEHVSEPGTLGLTWIRTTDVDELDAEIMGLQQRDDMNTISFRAAGSAGIENLNLMFEYAKQDRDNDDEHAWYLEGSWTFADLPWAPTTTYRYSRFSEDFDPLFYGLSRGYGTWFQGEVGSNYAGPFNKNARVHHVGLKATPLSSLTIGAQYFDFDSIDNDRGNLSGKELDFYAEWMVNDHLMLSPLIGIFQPDRSSDNGGTQLNGNGTNIYSQLIVATFF